MLKTLKLNNDKWKKSLFYEGKSLVGLTPGQSDKDNITSDLFKPLILL